MSTAGSTSSIEQIGQTAGLVWTALGEKGPLTTSQLVKAVAQPRDLVMQAMGWLAREDKITIEAVGRSRTVALR